MNIVLIGSGNVATHLGLAFKDVGFKIIQVYSRTLVNAKLLAKKLDTFFCADLSFLTSNGDLYVIAVKDAAISDVSKKIRLYNKNQLLVHTSGTLDITILSKSALNFGVIYPLQTLSKNIPVNMRKVPLCIEANNKKNEKILLSMAKKISNQVYLIDSEKRKILHLSAVFASNFTNLLYSIAEDLLKQYDLPFDLLKPLIRETTDKIMLNKPAEVQTGPAIRNDLLIIKKHLQKLKFNKEYQKIYKILSEAIRNNLKQ